MATFKPSLIPLLRSLISFLRSLCLILTRLSFSVHFVRVACALSRFSVLIFDFFFVGSKFISVLHTLSIFIGFVCACICCGVRLFRLHFLCVRFFGHLSFICNLCSQATSSIFTSVRCSVSRCSVLTGVIADHQSAPYKTVRTLRL